MTPRPIEQARDADLRALTAALARAALRARVLAAQTGTFVVVSRAGVIELVAPSVTQAPVAQEPDAPYGTPR